MCAVCAVCTAYGNHACDINKQLLFGQRGIQRWSIDAWHVASNTCDVCASILIDKWRVRYNFIIVYLYLSVLHTRFTVRSCAHTSTYVTVVRRNHDVLCALCSNNFRFNTTLTQINIGKKNSITSPNALFDYLSDWMGDMNLWLPATSHISMIMCNVFFLFRSFSVVLFSFWVLISLLFVFNLPGACVFFFFIRLSTKHTLSAHERNSIRPLCVFAPRGTSGGLHVCPIDLHAMQRYKYAINGHDHAIQIDIIIRYECS